MTPDEARDQIIEAARAVVAYWSSDAVAPKTPGERVSGAIFSLLAELDGVGSIPACDIVMGECDDEGNVTAEVRVSTMLHEFFHDRPARLEAGEE